MLSHRTVVDGGHWLLVITPNKTSTFPSTKDFLFKWEGDAEQINN